MEQTDNSSGNKGSLDNPIDIHEEAETFPLASEPAPVEDAEPISLAEENLQTGEFSGMKVRQIGRGAQETVKKDFRRPVNVTGQGATRCRMFRCRIALDSMENMQKRINDWLDSEEVEVKHVGHVLGVMEGKSPRPNLVVLVWY